MLGMDLQNHYSLSSSSEVSEICDSTLKSLGITYFNYIKVFPNGSRELLTNNALWIDHFYKKALYQNVGAIDVEHLLPKGYFLWSELDANDAVYSQGRESFNIDNGISFVIKRDNATLLYIFGSTRNNYAINNFYMRNIDLLKRFILYFNDKASDLINRSRKHKIILPKKQIICPDRINKILLSQNEREEFYEKTSMDRFFILSESDNLYLTKKEAECVAFMAFGATAKQCATRMGISFRTVESYLDNIKNKLLDSTGKRFNKNELINFLKKAGIHDIVFPYKIKLFDK